VSAETEEVVFNGYARQYDAAPLSAHVGERVRFWVLAAGPNRGSSFHVAGGQFDTVYREGAYDLRPGEGVTGEARSSASRRPRGVRRTHLPGSRDLPVRHPRHGGRGARCARAREGPAVDPSQSQSSRNTRLVLDHNGMPHGLMT
jgi:hypothetical protein